MVTVGTPPPRQWLAMGGVPQRDWHTDAPALGTAEQTNKQTTKAMA